MFYSEHVIPIFLISALAGYLLAPLIRAISGLPAKSQKDDTCRPQGRNHRRTIVGVVLLVIACLIVVLPLFDWVEIARILASSRVAALVLGMLTGTLVEHWHMNVVGDHDFNEKWKLHSVWLGVIGSLMVLGIGLPYIWMVAGSTGVHSLKTAGFQIEFTLPTNSSRDTLTFEVERHVATRGRLQQFVEAMSDNGLLAGTL